MALNEYDDAVEQLAPAPRASAPANPYDATLDAIDAGQQQQLRTSLQQTADQSPDSAAAAAKIAASTNLPLEVVQRNLPDMQRRAKIADTPFDAIVRDTPTVASWAAKPENAAVSHDDMEQLGALDWLMSMPSRAISQSLNEQAYGELRTKSIFQPLTQAEHDQMAAYKFYATQGGELGAGNSWFKGALTKTMKLLTTLAAPEAIPTAAGALAGGIVGGLGGGLVAGPAGVIPGAIAVGKLGAEAGYTYGLGSSAFRTATASALDEYSEMTDAVGRKLDPEVAKALAVTNGAINAGLMTFGGHVIGAAIDKAGSAVAAKLTKQTVQAAIRQPSVVGAIAEAVKGYGTTLTEGSALMVAMKVGDILTHSMAQASGDRQPLAGQLEPGNVDLFKQPVVANADGSTSTVDSFSVNIDGKEVLLPTVMPDGRHVDQETAIKEYEQTGRHLGKFDSPQAANAFATQLHEDYAAGKYQQPTIGQQLIAAAKEGVQAFALIGATGPALGLARSFRGAQRAQQGVAFFQALGEGVEQSKTHKRLPEAMQSFVDQATKDGPISTVYTSVEDWQTYWQGKGVDPAEMAAEVTGSKDAYDNALKTGEDLAIPTSRYATKLAATEHAAHFADELRLGPEEMNGREATALIEKMSTAPDAGQPAESGTPVYTAALEQLTKGGGLSPDTAAQYAGLVDAAFGSMAERAGVDPTELYKSYGLTVDRPDIPNEPEKPAAAASGGQPGASGEAGGQGELLDAGGRPVGGYAGPERRAAEQAANELKRRASDQPIPAMADVIGTGADIQRRAAAMRAENPNIEREAAAMKAKAAKAGRIPEPEGAGRRSVVDKKADAAENPDGYFNAGTQDARTAAPAEEGQRLPDGSGEQPRADQGGRAQAGSAGDGAQPGRLPTPGLPDVDETFRKPDPADVAARLTPGVRSALAWIADELHTFPTVDQTWNYVGDEHGWNGNAGGGKYDVVAGEAGTPVWTDVLAFSPVNTQASGRNKGKPAAKARGSRAKVLEAVRSLLETGEVTNNLQEGALRVAENRLANNFELLSRPWLPRPDAIEAPKAFTDRLAAAIDRADQPADMLNVDDVHDSLDDQVAGDTSFDVTEFSQSLFDELQPPDPKADTLATGEEQPRLPGDVGDVREKDVQTPEFEAPFALTSEVAKPTKGGQKTLFQSAPVTAETLDAFAADVKARYGADLNRFELGLNRNGDVSLNWIMVDRGAQRAGLGSKVMLDLTRYADSIGRRLVLTPAEGADEVGTSSYDRLVKFYQRFGFVENKGPHKDFGIRSGMYREPTAIPGRELGQPLFHGSPHDFERFSLDKVGTGEGAAAYGHGLYFAENPAVAAQYHDQLSEGRDVVSMKLGRMTLKAPEFDYTRNAHVNDVENLRAAIAEDLLGSPLDLNAAGEAGFRDHVLAMVDQRIADYEREYPEGVKAAEKLRKELEKPGALSVEFTKTTGGVYQVDIPDEHLNRMLDWDKGLAEQPANVQEALAKIDPDLWAPGGTDYDANETGASIYHRLADKLGKQKISPVTGEPASWTTAGTANDFDPDTKKASETLRAAGVPGLRYLDQGSRDNFIARATTADGKLHGAASFATRAEAERWGRQQEAAGATTTIEEAGDNLTRNVVAFDESIVKLTHKDGKPFTPEERKEFFQTGEHPDAERQQAQPRRGSIRFGPDRQFHVDLLERADLSTFLHESGHFFLEVFGDLADQIGALPLEQLTEEQKHLLSDYGTTLQALGVENREQIGTPQHEDFARMFEAYLREGKAPSLALQTPFARFRAWLLSIYDSLKKLNINLTPEVRGVFDRMLATDQAIGEAEQQRGVQAMFLTAEDAGMDPKEFQLYARTVADAHQKATQLLDEKLMRDVFREQSREWKARRAEIRATVESDVQQRPEYRAIDAMRRGTHPNGEPLIEGLITPPLQLSREILEQRFGKDRIARLPRGVVGRDGGLDPDVVANMFGYSSADAMLTAVEKAPAMKDVIERETKRQMIAEQGSILLDGSLHPKAQAAVANDVRDEVIKAEMRALGRKRREVDPFVKAERAKGRDALQQEQAERAYERRWFEAEAKLRIAIAEGHKQVEIDDLTQQVRDLRAKARGGAAVIRAAIPSADTLRDAAAARINAMRIGDIQPATFWSASRRAGQQALERAARQDFDGAITAKQQELINLNLYRQAQQALEDVEDRVRFAQDLGRPAARKMFGLAGQSYLDQVDGILDRFEFAKVSQKALDRRGALAAFVSSLEAQGLPVDMPEELLDESKRRNYKQLTIDELRGVTDGLKELQHLARLKNRLLRSAEKRELDTVAGTVAQAIRDNFRGTPATQVERDRRVSNERSRMIGDFFASHRKMASLVREMDGFVDGGPLWEQLIRPLNEAGDREADMVAHATKTFGTIIEDAYPRSEKRLLYEKQEIPEVGQSLSRMERLTIALNWGNEGGRDRIRRGEGWTDQQVHSILDTLDARDLKFVQSTLDAINTYWPEIAAKQERVYGIAPEKVDAAEYTAKNGTVSGGYYPLKYDDRADPKAGAHLDYESANLGKAAAYAQATTKRGHTKERVSNVKMPLRRDFGVIFEHVNQVIHDLSHHEALIDVNRVLSHKDVQKAIYETHGDLTYRQFKNGVRDVAFGQVPAVNAFERAIGHVRTGATVAGLGWSLSTAMLHLSSALPRAIVRIGPEYVAKGIARWTRDAVHMENTAKWIDDSSTMMRNRSRTQQREINELRNQVGVNTGKFSGWVADIVDKTSLGLVGKQGLVDSYFYLVQQAQRIADVPTWLGQYEKSMAAGHPEKDAIAHADQAVLDAFGGGQNKDLAAVQRGGPLLRLWTNFYSPFNVTYNLTVEANRRARFNDPGSIGRLAVDYLMLYTVPATMGMLIHGALKANPQQSANDEDATTIAAELLKGHAAYAADTMLGFRELSGVIEGYRGYEGPAGARLFSSVGRVISQAENSAAKVHEGKADEAFGRQFWLSLNDAGGVIFHYPSGQVGRTLDGIAALIEGKTSNPGALIAGAPKQK